MLRHKGKARTFIHNLRLASVLSTVAGIVNITGVLSLGTLTTNVTGHFAYFSEELFLKEYATAITFLFCILFFLFGAFISSFIMEWTSRHRHMPSYIIPISVEIVCITAVAFSDLLREGGFPQQPIVFSFVLLFAMGLQNALVTKVSQSVVRTTHLTGLFTDLGIELSQLPFHKERQQKIRLKRSIYLKLSIIGCFFLGGILGGYVHRYAGLMTLLVPALLLLYVMWYDRLLFQYYHIKRKFR
ncbi:DUF1275 domain-containing protein [Fluviicola sp. SGL-29]|nr:DUF1275 domain-containing protein [Fluviicola sp. SGL-29]